MRRAALLLVVAAILVGLAVWWRARRETPAATAPTPAARPAATPGTTGPATAAPTAALGPAAGRKDRTVADRLRRDIERARARRNASRPAPAPAPATAGGSGFFEDPTLDKEYVRERVREVLPLIQECYEQSLERRPALAGRIVVSFRIAGEPGVGGVVEDGRIEAERTTLDDEDTLTCVRESLYAMTFVAPAEGGVVDVTYPFEFRVEDEPADAGR